MDNSNEEIIFLIRHNEKSILNELKKYDIETYICEIANTIYRKIVNYNLEYNNKDIIFRKNNFVKFMFWCCYMAYCQNGVPITPDALRKKFKLNKGDVTKCPSQFSTIKLNCNINIKSLPSDYYFKGFIDNINAFPDEIKKCLTIVLSSENKMNLDYCRKMGYPCNIRDSIEGYNFNDDVVQKLVLFSEFIMKYNPELRSSSPPTAYAGIFSYYMTKILNINIQHKYMHMITVNSYATDSKNIEIIGKTILERTLEYQYFYETYLC